MKESLIIIDWYQTLSNDRLWENECEKHVFQSIQEKFFKDSEVINEWMRGKFSSEEICALLSKNVRETKETLLKMLENSCRAMKIDHILLEYLKNMGRKHKIVLVTDNMDCFARWTAPGLESLNVFSEISISSNKGLLKNDQEGQVWKEVLNKYGADFADAILIDDSATLQILFSKLGGAVIPIKGVEDTKKALLEFQSIE